MVNFISPAGRGSSTVGPCSRRSSSRSSPCATSREKIKSIIRERGSLKIIDSPSAWNEWTLRETDKGWTIQVRLSREKPETRFLGVDAGEKVTLVLELGDGAYWTASREYAGNRRADGHDFATYAFLVRFFSLCFRKEKGLPMKCCAICHTAVIATLCFLAASNQPAVACTGIRIKPKDGSVIAARTMEFAADLHSNVVLIPRATEFVTSLTSSIFRKVQREAWTTVKTLPIIHFGRVPLTWKTIATTFGRLTTAASE